MRYWGIYRLARLAHLAHLDRLARLDLVVNLVHPADDLVVHPAETTPDSIEALGRGVTTKTPRRELPAMKHIG